MLDLRSEKSFIYRIALPVMQVLVCILLILAMTFDDTLEDTSDILRNISIAIQFLILAVVGIRELIIRKNRIEAYLCFGGLLIGLIFIIYICII
ncbi:MAG TPA: hypothetical protein VEG39_08200 [Clostridia bacterium]|nr:hypothetical protein [Clostridia bacterium]